MDILLLAITIVSLVIALFMGIAAWGVWREERARSAARVAALASAAATDEQPAAQMTIRPVPQNAVATPVEKRAPWSAPADWRRLPQPVAAPEPPASHVTRDSEIAPDSHVAAGPHAGRSSRVTETHDAFGASFLAPAAASGGHQRSLAIAALVLIVAITTGGYLMLAADTDNAATPVTSSSTATSPLELISLRHERQDGALAITGLVRNPNGGQQVRELTAVALLFDQKGEFITSSRAGVDFTQLAPGDESPFVIRLDAPAHVARYRVSFRTDAGVVPHVDRRGQEPIARDLP